MQSVTYQRPDAEASKVQSCAVVLPQYRLSSKALRDTAMQKQRGRERCVLAEDGWDDGIQGGRICSGSLAQPISIGLC